MASVTKYFHEIIKGEPDNWDWASVGLDNYPIHNELLRPGLNEKIRQHFWNREISAETTSMWLLFMQRTMNENMPVINQHYKANEVEVNPLLTVDVKNSSVSEGSGTSNSKSDTTSDSDAASRVIQSDTPQTLLSPTGEYAAGAADSVSKTNAKAGSVDDSTSSQTGAVDSTVKGFQGNAAMAVLQWRQTFVNVDMMVIEALESCFLQIWSTGDESLEGGNYYGGIGGIGRFGIGRGFGVWL